MVLGINFFEVNPGRAFVFAQVLNRCGPGGGDHVAAIELSNGGDARGCLDRNSHLLHVGGEQKGHVFLARGGVGGGAAFDVYGAVLQQGNAVLRGHRQVFDIQLLAGGSFKIGQNALAQLHMEPRVFAISQRVRQRARGIPHPHGDS